MKKFEHLKADSDEPIVIKDPKDYATELMAGKNLWLTKIRWIYTSFILVFFLIYNSISAEISMGYRSLGLILGLAALVNIIFTFTLKRGLKFPSEKHDFKLYMSLASVQLDFDLVILSLLVFFSGGFESPVAVLFIFYIMVAPFLIQRKKAFRSTLIAIILVVVIYFSKEGLVVSTKGLTFMIAFSIILLFAFFISAYLSGNLKENEQKIQGLLQKTRELSVTDGLTGLYNQSYFFLQLKLQLEKSKRYHSTFSLIMFDLDHFKNYNDSNGHVKGSEALHRVGELMKKVFRSTDILAKYGGDEFVIILPNSDKVGAFLAADRLREIVDTETFEGEEHQPLGGLTLSLGVASYPDHGQSVEEILNRADKALYAAKKTGRNKTVIYNEDLENETGTKA